MNQIINKGLKIVFFIILILVLDHFIGLYLHKFYFSQKFGQNHSLTYSLKDCKAEILIFGSSQAQHNYISKQISDTLKMSCYNAGQDGGHSILLQYAQIKVITARYTPKIIILDIWSNKFVRFPGDYDRLQILLPYYKDYPEILSTIMLRGPYEKFKLMSAIYPFNSNIINIIRYNTNYHISTQQDFEGYVPLNGVMSSELLKQKNDNVEKPNSVVDSNMVNAFKNIILHCKEKNICLYVISSPIAHAINEKQPFSSVSKCTLEIIKNYDVNYIDLSFDSTLAGHYEWFKDKFHLNHTGATVFTEKLIHIIQADMSLYK